MGNLDTESGKLDRKLHKYLELLRTPANKTKSILINQLKQSRKRFRDELSNLEPHNQKTGVSKKLEKIKNNLNILQELSEDDIVTYALTTSQNLMKLAANPRTAAETRMKARVCCHKPLSTHLARVKRRLQDAEQSEEETISDDYNTLNKIIVNNQIIKMRKCIKRSKVYIMHHLTRSLARLRASKATGKLKEKNERKVDRMVKRIKYIKKLDVNDVARFALTTTQERIKELSTDIKAPSNTQAMAVLAVHKFVFEPTAAFKNLYPDWQKTIPKHLKKKSKKRKLNIEMNEDEIKPKKQKSNTESKESRPHLLRQVDKLDDMTSNDSSDNQDEESEDVDEESTERSDKEKERERKDEGETSEDTDKDEDEDQINDTILKALDNSTDNETYNNKERLIEDRVKENYKVKLKGKESVKLKLRDKNNAPVKKNKLTNAIKKVGSKDDNISEASCDESPAQPSFENRPKVIDPFFVTVNNEEYVTRQNPNAYEDNDTNLNNTKERFKNKTHMFNQFDKLSKWGESRGDSWKRNQFSSRESRPLNRNNFNRFEKPALGIKTPVGNFVGNRKERRKSLHQSLQPEKVEKLHPSWEAKKKQTTIASFQGKKVVFD